MIPPLGSDDGSAMTETMALAVGIAIITIIKASARLNRMVKNDI